MTRRLLAAAVLAFSLLAPPRAGAAVPPEVDALVRDGIRDIFAMDFDGAESRFKQAQTVLPDYPYGYYGQAIVSFARFVYASQLVDQGAQARFEKDVDLSIAKSKAWLAKHPEDADIHLSLGASNGLRSRLYVIQKRWFKALWDGRTAIKETRRAYALDPGLKDALLGIGMYDYYADALPRGVAVFSHLVLGGDRKKGIEELKIAAEKGRYVGVGARLILIEIYTEDAWGAKDPPAALRLIQDLRKEFPGSPMFHQIEQVCLYETSRYDELLASVDEYMRRIQSGMPYYPSSDLPRQHVSVGTVRFAQKRHEEAEQAFAAAGTLAGTPKAPSRWGVWGLVRLGQVRDVLGRRPPALDAYRAVLGFPDTWGFHAAAKRGLSAPFKAAASGIGPLPPP